MGTREGVRAAVSRHLSVDWSPQGWGEYADPETRLDFHLLPGDGEDDEALVERIVVNGEPMSAADRIESLLKPIAAENGWVLVDQQSGAVVFWP